MIEMEEAYESCCTVFQSLGIENLLKFGKGSVSLIPCSCLRKDLLGHSVTWSS